MRTNGTKPIKCNRCDSDAAMFMNDTFIPTLWQILATKNYFYFSYYSRVLSISSSLTFMFHNHTHTHNILFIANTFYIFNPIHFDVLFLSLHLYFGVSSPFIPFLFSPHIFTPSHIIILLSSWVINIFPIVVLLRFILRCVFYCFQNFCRFCKKKKHSFAVVFVVLPASPFY